MSEKDPNIFLGPFVPLDKIPPFVGRGGEQLVYETPDKKRLVKFSHYLLGTILNKEVLQQILPAGITEEHEEYAARTLFRTMWLSECFGSEHTLNEFIKACELPLSGKACRELWPQSTLPDNEIRWFKTIARFQDKAEPLANPADYKTLDFCLPPYELQPVVDELLYSAASHRWLGLQDHQNPKEVIPDGPFTEADRVLLLATSPGHSLPRLLQSLEQDDSLRASCVEFVSKAITYSNMCGEGLDIMGENNVLFYKSDDTDWNFMLIDALAPVETPQLHRLPSIFSDVRMLRPLTSEQSAIAFNSLGYVRTINALAHMLDLSERITVDTIPMPSTLWPALLERVRTFQPKGLNFPTQLY